MFIKEDMSNSGIAMMLVASALLTVPFIFYAKDIADSLRDISGRNQINIKSGLSQP